MSYHAQQNTQQKTFGLFIVFAFHVILIWGFINGLGANISNVILPDPITTTVIDQPKIPITPITPADPIIIKSNVQFTLPKTVDPHDFIDPPAIIDGPIDIGDSIEFTTQPKMTKPTVRKASKPEYPLASSRLGEEGTTGLQLSISDDGHVIDAQVFKSSGSAWLDTAAVKHVIHSWMFNPCTQDGKAVACAYKTNLTWRLADARR